MTKLTAARQQHDTRTHSKTSQDPPVCRYTWKKKNPTAVYAENTVRQNTKQILCLFSACDHLKGIFQRPGLILAPAKWSFHSTLAIFSPSEGKDWTKARLCDQIVSEWAICMQIHLVVNNAGGHRWARLYGCVHLSQSTWIYAVLGGGRDRYKWSQNDYFSGEKKGYPPVRGKTDFWFVSNSHLYLKNTNVQIMILYLYL